jgi:photosystem II stability/assembly factor-like uncharacterized protein
MSVLRAMPLLLCGALAAQPSVTITLQQSGTTARLQAVSAVDERVVWASGVAGTFVVTTDGGTTWTPGIVPGAERLEFRDVEAISATEAFLLAAGNGEDSRIYHTRDGGKHWALQFTNTDARAFYDCFSFWDPEHGITMSDGVGGVFPVLRTSDGRTWSNIGGRMPPADSGEGAFAASGTCVATIGKGNAWIATGAGPRARVLATTDGGATWKAYTVPIVHGTATSGGTSIAFRDVKHGILVGGDLSVTDSFTANVARTPDGGRSWVPGSHPTFPGAIYGVAYVPGMPQTIVATGPGGASWSPDEGSHWLVLDTLTNYWAVAFTGPGTGWLVGTDGRIARVSFRR